VTVTPARTRRIPALGRGFGYLTLDPSPRLQRARQESQDRLNSPVSWQDLRRALAEARAVLVPTLRR
jgi:hypothetical protein